MFKTALSHNILSIEPQVVNTKNSTLYTPKPLKSQRTNHIYTSIPGQKTSSPQEEHRTAAPRARSSAQPDFKPLSKQTDAKAPVPNAYTQLPERSTTKNRKQQNGEKLKTKILGRRFKRKRKKTGTRKSHLREKAEKHYKPLEKHHHKALLSPGITLRKRYTQPQR